MKRIVLTSLIAMSSFAAQARTFSVMAYNAENFFDTVQDTKIDDYTWLPMAVKKTIPNHSAICNKIRGAQYVKDCLTIDWNENIYAAKIANISKVIRSFDESNKGPDVVVLSEIENITVIKDLVARGLADGGYNHVALIEGDDSRGIDIGVISRYPITSSTRHPIFFNGRKLNTRGITQVEVNVEGKKVVVFGNHWPSQGNTTPERQAAAEVLNQAAHAVSADLIVAVGDFNVIRGETPSPFNIMTEFTDSEKEARKVRSDLMPGTHNYKNAWDSLDRIFVIATPGVTPKYEKYEIIARPYMLSNPKSHEDDKGGPKIGTPIRFNHTNGSGFSDHLPVVMSFDL